MIPEEQGVQREQGKIEEVAEYVFGDELAANASAGALTLTVADAADFNEDGGSLTVGAETLAYTSVDDDTGVVTLGSPLASAHVAGDRVLVAPDTRERQAMVRLDTDGEAVDARVPHALYDRLPEGTRADAGEPVSLYLDGDEWVIEDVLGLAPSVDGSYIVADTLPPAEFMPDGLPPASAPVVEVTPLGIGALLVEWTPLVNHDPVSYAVHLSLVSGFTPGPLTLAATVQAQSSVTLAEEPDGSALSYDTHYVRVIPSDDDGAGPMSAEASAQARKAENGDFSAETVYAMKVSANSIESGEVDAELIVGGAIKTALTGQRVEISGENGLVNYGPDNVPRVILPTGGTDPAVLRGVAEVDTLAVIGNAELQSGAHVTKGKTLALDGSVQPPVSQPGLSSTYGSLALDEDSLSAPGYRKGLEYVSGKWWECVCPDGTFLRRYDAVTGHLDASLALAGCSTTMGNPDCLVGLGGLAHSGTSFYVLGYRAGNQQWQIREFSDSTGAEVRRWNTDLATNSPSEPKLCLAVLSGTPRLAVAKVNATGSIVFQVWSLTGAQVGVNTTVTVYSTAGGLNVQSLAYGQFDFASVSRFLLTGAVDTVAFDSAGVYDSARGFRPAATLSGMAWDGLRLVARLASKAELRYYTSVRAETAGSLFTAAAEATYRDSVNGWETAPGPARTITSAFKRSGLSVNVASLPTGVDSVRFHLSVAGGAFAPFATQPALGVLAADYLTLTTSGTTPSVSTFPADVSAKLTVAGKTLLDGDLYGTHRSGDLKMTAVACAGSGAALDMGGTWLLCDGTAVSRTTFAALFAALGTAYGAGNGTTTFNLPDFRGRFPLGAGTFAALAANDGTAESGRTPRHQHGIVGNAHTHGPGSLTSGVVSRGTAAPVANTAQNPVTGNTGSDSHDHGGLAQLSAVDALPYLGVNVLIKA